MSSFRDQVDILAEIIAERDRQDRKHGADRDLPHGDWLIILGEEIGEACKAILEGDGDGLWTELVQCAAVVVAWLECIKRRGPLGRKHASVYVTGKVNAGEVLETDGKKTMKIVNIVENRGDSEPR